MWEVLDSQEKTTAAAPSKEQPLSIQFLDDQDLISEEEEQSHLKAHDRGGQKENWTIIIGIIRQKRHLKTHDRGGQQGDKNEAKRKTHS